MHGIGQLFVVGDDLVRTDLQVGQLAERGLQGRQEFGLQLRIKGLAAVFGSYVADHSGVEQHGIGQSVGINAGAADGDVDVDVGPSVDHAERNRVGGAELIVNDFLRVEVVNALILTGAAAHGETAADDLEGLQQALAELAGEDGRFGGGIPGEFAGFRAELNDLALFYDHHALAVGNNDAGAVGDDIIRTLGVGGTAADALLALDHQRVLVQCFTVEKFLPLIGKNTADRTQCCRNKTHNLAPFNSVFS